MVCQKSGIFYCIATAPNYLLITIFGLQKLKTLPVVECSFSTVYHAWLRSHIKTRAFVFHQGIETPRNNKSTQRPFLVSMCLDTQMNHSPSFIHYATIHFSSGHRPRPLVGRFSSLSIPCLGNWSTQGILWFRDFHVTALSHRLRDKFIWQGQ